MQRTVINNNQRLANLMVGRASVLTFKIINAPRHLEEIQVHFSRLDSGEFTPVAATAEPDGTWRVYANGLLFPDEGRITYHITGMDDGGGEHWLGEGFVFVRPSVRHIKDPSTQLIPEDTYIRNPATGLWHKLSVTFEDGEMISQIEQEGITR